MQDIAIHDLRFLDLDQLRGSGHGIRDEALDLVRKRRRKQPGAPPGGRHLDNPDNLLAEPHAQHFVRFVQHEMLHGIEPEGAEFQQIKEPPRRRHDDVRRTFQPVNLEVDFVATTGDFYENLFRAEFRILKKLLADLFGELTRRSDDESLHRRVGGIDLREQRQPERRRLAGPSLSLRNKIPAILDEIRNRAGLNGGRSGNPERVEPTNQILRNAEL